MALVNYYGTGRRKTSVARVRLVPGEGNVIINNRELKDYFGLKTLELIIKQPLNLTETIGKYDVLAKVEGGGPSGQAGAIRHGIARALLKQPDILIMDEHNDCLHEGLYSHDNRQVKIRHEGEYLEY